MDYFNDAEVEKQAEFAKKRDQFFRPVVTALAGRGITPAGLSIAGILAALVASLIPADFWILTAVLLGLYVLMDGLDGPLARLTGSQSQGGSMLDIFADQVGVIFVAVGAVVWLDANAFANILFAFFYINAIYLIVLCKFLGAGIPLILRVKYVYFVLYVVSLAFEFSILIDVFCAVFLAYYAIFFAKLFRMAYDAVNARG